MFKVKNKQQRLWCLYFWLWTYFTPCVFIVNFEPEIAGWVEGRFNSDSIRITLQKKVTLETQLIIG